MIIKMRDFFIKKAVAFVGGQKYLTMQFDITNACNLSCTHCYQSHHKNSGALNLDQWKSVLDQYDKLRNKLYLKPCIVICGGEPLTSPILFPFLDEIQSRFGDAKVFVLTNGTRIDEVVARKLNHYGVTVQVSLDGATALLHDKVRGQGNFNKAILGIHILRQQNVKTVIQAVLSKNTSQQIKVFFALAKTLRVHSMNFTRLMPTGNGKKLVTNQDDEVLGGLQLRDAMLHILESSEKFGVKTNTNQPLYHLIDDKLGESGKFGFQGLVVDYKGYLKISSRTDLILGNVLSDGLETMFFNHPLLRKIRNRHESECGSCEYYMLCGGNRSASYIETGSFLTKDPACWYNGAQHLTEVI